MLGREGREKPNQPKARKIVKVFLFRAVWDSRDKSTCGARIGRFAARRSISSSSGDFCPGQAGTKVREGREGREKVKKPQKEARKPESADAGECVRDSPEK
ncbi:hypothetical protein KI387_012515, partial [Taxus chinensis]